MSSTNADSEKAKENTGEPMDFKVVKHILHGMGIHDFESRVPNQLLEFMYRYTTEILQDACEYRDHVGSKALGPEEIQLAIQGRLNCKFSPPPAREQLMELAEKANNKPLPPIPTDFGLHLPAPENQLTMDNIRVMNTKELATNSSTTSSGSTATSMTTSAAAKKKATKLPIAVTLAKRKRDS